MILIHYYNFVLRVFLTPFLWSKRDEERPRERGCLDYPRAYHVRYINNMSLGTRMKLITTEQRRKVSKETVVLRWWESIKG